MLNCVTFTGADDSVSPSDLLSLQMEFPFIEYGILLSKGSEGKSTRFPTKNWISSLPTELNLCGHLCGKWIDELVAGDFTYLRDRAEHVHLWRRMQLNFHGLNFEPSPKMYEALTGKQFIFQIDGVNQRLYSDALTHKVNAVPLFDMSHGQGISPKVWLAPIADYCGYAGGLSPDNLHEELKRIASVTGDKLIWIDFETHIRSDYDYQFDLEKVRKCCEIAALLIGK